MSGEAAKAVVRGVVGAIDRQDLEALRAHPGLHETVRHIPMLWAAFPDLAHSIERQVAEGEMVATVARVRGTHRGPLLGVAPTGREVSFLLLMVDQVADGRVVLHYGLPDWLAVLGPLGALPGPAHP